MAVRTISRIFGRVSSDFLRDLRRFSVAGIRDLPVAAMRDLARSIVALSCSRGAEKSIVWRKKYSLARERTVGRRSLGFSVKKTIWRFVFGSSRSLRRAFSAEATILSAE